MRPAAPSRRSLPVLVAALLLVALGASGLVRAGASSAATPTVTAARKAQIAASTSQPRVWGATGDEIPWDADAMSDLAAVAGRNAGIAMWYVAWSLNSSFPIADADRVAASGAEPEITWEPWDPSAGVDQPRYALANITAGDFDAYLTSWAKAVAAWGRPIRIRFAHEMNGDWYPWAQGVNGNAAGSYVAAWRHVVGIFDAAGATNVTWVWSPNVPYPGSTALAGLYPGDRWVGEADLDGYNWATLQGGRWTSFAGVFAAGVAQLSKLSTRPIGIGEVGCPQAGGAKDAWISAMWSTLANWPRVRTLVWFDFDKETDWRIDSSSASASAFRAGLSGFLAG